MSADVLYGLPLDRFVPERTALARALRAEGRRDDAVVVTRARKPSVAAWAVNQLVRTQARAVTTLFEAGNAVREAQVKMLAGQGDGRTLRAAAEHERTAVEELVKAARGLLTSEGHGMSAAIIDRVADTLHAAALDDGARGQVREGRLERELRHAGLGADAGGSTEPVRDVTRRKQVRKADQGERAIARKAVRAAESDARRLADRAARALDVAQERRERASQVLREAEEALAKAQAEAETSAAAHRRAEQKLKTVDR
jgi:hypothetical protein